MPDESARHGDGFIRRIVKHLDFQLLARIVQPAHRLQQAINHKLLIENGKLHRDPRQFREFLGRLSSAVLLILVIEIYQRVAMNSIRREQNQHKKIRHQQCHVKGIGVVKALKRSI